jgi:hypothetical protein
LDANIQIHRHFNRTRTQLQYISDNNADDEAEQEADEAARGTLRRR